MVSTARIITAMSPSIRLATPADAPAIAWVHIASWQTAYRGIVSDAHLDQLMSTYPTRVARWESGLRQPEHPGTVTLVMETAGVGIAGFASVGPARRGELGFRGELWAIYLLAEQRRQGLGRLLFGRCVQHLRDLGSGDMYLLVMEKNPACQFYRRMGGIQVPGFTLDAVIGGTPVVEVAYGWKHLPGPDDGDPS